MKKSLFIIVMLLIALPMFAEHVDPETARKVAATFLSNNGAKTAQLTDLTQKAGFQNLYIFTSEEGFVVMAADDCVKPILGYSLSGKFVTEGMPENVRGWFQGYNDEIQYLVENHVKASAETANEWSALANREPNAGKVTAVVGNLLSTTWDQDPLYNNLCPYDPTHQELTVTGCVATAMAQIMKYWGYPSHGIGSHSYTHSTYGLQSADYGATTYNWTEMPNSLTSTSSPTQINQIATLMYQCGVSVNMDYGVSGTGGSSAVTAYVADALQAYFNYQPCNYLEKNSYTGSTWLSMLKTELDADRPLQYCGSGSKGGHSFVCCGYDNSDKFYFNWGWSGTCDGYYSLSSLNPSSGGSGSAGLSFSQDQAAIFGIQPVQCAATEPTNLTYNLSGLRSVTLNWAGGSGAVSYKIYHNGILVGSSTSTTFTDDASFGTNNYFVRSVDCNGNLSLSSNYASFTIEYQSPVVTDLTATLSGNNVNLSWTAPVWCYPETPSATLTYGTNEFNSSIGYNGSTHMYWGHLYPTNSLGNYGNLSVYKISFLAVETGNYGVYIYEGTTSGHPSTLVHSQQITVSSTGWSDIDLTNPQLLDTSKDLWVFINDPVGRNYPAPFCSFSGDNGNYFSPNNPTSSVQALSNASFLIKTYLTDGVYTYNLYDGENKVNGNTPITETSYIIASPANNTAHQYTVKTNYYGGETDASNMAGLTLGTASLGTLELGTNDKMTVTANSKLTVTGTLSNSDPVNLILEDGAQLVHNSTGVQATVKKNINPYTSDDNGWYFIASPVTENITPSEANGLISGGYDLYLFNQSEAKAWRNFRAGSFTTVNHKKGYLYANNTNQALSFCGTLASTTTATVLDYDANARFKGFNLVGNPYPCNATINQDFCVISGKNVILAESGQEIAPCEGVFVRATAANQELTFNKVTTGAKNHNNDEHLDLVVTQGKDLIDRARVRFGKGIGMEKYSLNDEHSRLSLLQDGQPYAVAYINNHTEMPLNFKAVKNGTYTLSIPETLHSHLSSLTYLHLIDNMTGADIDLLATPSYTFEAKTSDYASRFKLVFANENDNDYENEFFAYINNDEIILTGVDACDASLQVIDMMGRVLLTREATPHSSLLIPNFSLSPGVYFLRLINDKQIKTQKIILNN